MRNRRWVLKIINDGILIKYHDRDVQLDAITPEVFPSHQLLSNKEVDDAIHGGTVIADNHPAYRSIMEYCL